ncbi:MAG TPA: tetratricopeptide repeat protein [Bryobacteraceae bacterium]|nr:tetratricopeptide repeat protein [Bryobacteraceae bacterium]
MPRGPLAILAIAVLAPAARGQSSSACSACHPAIWESYRLSGMARSFFRPGADNTIENYTNAHTYDHAASGIHFEMIERGEKYFQRQYQIGFDGKQTNVAEYEIDFVLGSGNHARTYLHRDAANRLIELPLGWYAEDGGYWAMNPGYDRPDHQDVERAVGYDCMFCHNAYPRIPANAGPRSEPVFLSVPEGIDCQRCHGDGARHIALARAGGPVEEIRAAIVNPARLAPDRQIEVCMQCHLETTSFSTAGSIVRYERGPFSYRPGEALADFKLYFDQKPENAAEDRFEIVGAVYRLRQSQCFLQSKGAMTCTTCHDPHRAEQPDYTGVCEKCHAAKLASLERAGRHPASADCVGCHMPKRRTQDAVHVVMTDHYIRRSKPAADLLATIAERPGPEYRGSVSLYYPAALPRAADDLYLAVAQVNDAAGRAEGIARLSGDLRKFRPEAAEFYLQLGDALRASGRFEQALAPYEEAVKREPQSAAAHERLALGLARARQYAKAEGEFQRALQLAPGDAAMWTHLGLAYLEQNRMADAAAAFEKSLAIDAEQPEAYNGLGGARMSAEDRAAAESDFRRALRIRPNYAEAQHNLANVLAGEGRFEEAQDHFEQALRIREGHSQTRFDYAAMFVREHRPDEAQRQLEKILRADPGHAASHDLLGRVLLEQGRTAEAISHFREAVQLAPDSARTNLDLGSALSSSGKMAAARPYLEKAAQASDPAIRDQARKLLEKR